MSESDRNNAMLAEMNKALYLNKREREERKIFFNCDTRNLSYEEPHEFREHPMPQKPFPVHPQAYAAPMNHEHLTVGNLPRVTCHICQKSLKNKYLLKTHLKIHAPDSEYTCPYCDYKNNNLFYMNIHINRHTKQPSYHCEICGQSFYEKTLLQAHVQVKHGRGFECGECDRRYGSRQRLRDHEKTHDSNYPHGAPHGGPHGGPHVDPHVGQQQCQECGKTYKHKAQWRNHMLKHRGLGTKYTCPLCGKAVTTKKSFSNHMKIHTGEKSSVCEICGKAFTLENYLVVHMRTHTGEKPYSCETCGKRFSQRVSLVIHKRYHTGERPYKCRICNKGYVTNTLLTIHLKTHKP